LLSGWLVFSEVYILQINVSGISENIR